MFGGLLHDVQTRTSEHFLCLTILRFMYYHINTIVTRLLVWYPLATDRKWEILTLFLTMSPLHYIVGWCGPIFDLHNKIRKSFIFYCTPSILDRRVYPLEPCKRISMFTSTFTLRKLRLISSTSSSLSNTIYNSPASSKLKFQVLHHEFAPITVLQAFKIQTDKFLSCLRHFQTQRFCHPGR